MIRIQTIKSKFLYIFLSCIIVFNFPVFGKSNEDKILLYAPISLSEGLKEVLSIYDKNNQKDKVNLVFMGTSQLVLQIKNGASPDIFISADKSWMDYLQSKELILKKFRKNYLYNSLVVITQKNNNISKIENVNNLKKILYKSKTKISLAMTKSIPAGMYARSYLKNINAWNELKSRYVESMNVRAALNFVSRGELEYGIVYKSDVLTNDKIKIVYSIEKEKHDEIIYPISILNTNNDTIHLYKFLLSYNSLLIMKKWGFEIRND